MAYNAPNALVLKASRQTFTEPTSPHYLNVLACTRKPIMDANNPNKDHRTTPEYAEYQRDNFWASNDGKVPPFNTGNHIANNETTTTQY
jgi:hypothetical protein